MVINKLSEFLTNYRLNSLILRFKDLNLNISNPSSSNSRKIPQKLQGKRRQNLKIFKFLLPKKPFKSSRRGLKQQRLLKKLFPNFLKRLKRLFNKS